MAIHNLSEVVTGGESFIFVPILAAFLIVGLIVAAIIIIRKQSERRREQALAARSDIFYPPFVGGQVPKEETYVVPRDWKPSALGGVSVYAPLSIPIRETRHKRSFSTVITALPPKVGVNL